MNIIADILSKKSIIAIDGALATELERRGADLRDALWSAKILLEAPEMIRDVHLAYFRAGADCAITASYQATVAGFAKRGLDKTQAIASIQKSVHLAQEARDIFWNENKDTTRVHPFIAGSVGPFGAFLADGSEYRGDYDLNEEQLMDFHRPRVKALIDAGVDVLACETIPCLLEARALARLLEEFPEARAWITFSAQDEVHICHGENISACAAFLDAASQVEALGVNCTSPLYITGLIRNIRGATQKPIIVYPNSGEIYDATTNTWHGETSCDAFGEQARAWYEAGARLIGGCCRTTPEHIQMVVRGMK